MLRQPRSIRAATIALCLVLIGCSSCLDDIDCTGDYLFQDWVQTSFAGGDGGVLRDAGTSSDAGVSSDGGTTPPSIDLDLTRGHFGAGQSFVLGGCSYSLDIEADDSEAQGTFSFTNPEPDSTVCIANEYTQLWTLSCDELVVTSPRGTATYMLPDN